MIPRSRTRRDAIRIAASKASPQARRLVEYLDDCKQPVLTGRVAAAIACSNISQAANRANTELEPLGYRIVARLPKPLSLNRFGDKSLAHLWAIERVR